jgi:hypothetical protein
MTEKRAFRAPMARGGRGEQAPAVEANSAAIQVEVEEDLVCKSTAHGGNEPQQGGRM